MSPQELALREQESQILDAARDIVLKGGIDALSMRAVAEKVGVSATALYHYYANKSDLVRKVIWSAFAEFDQHLVWAVEDHPVGSMDRVRAIGEAYITFALENQACFGLIFSSHDYHDAASIEELPGGGGYPLLKDSVSSAMDSGEMRRADPELVSFYLWSVVHGIVTISLACRSDDRPCEGSHIPSDPLALFRAIAPLMRDGLVGPSSSSMETVA